MSYLIVAPALMQVPCQGGQTTHTFECVGTDRICFRVRLKKKYYELYKVNPPLGFIQPGEKKQVVLERRAGKPGKTFLLVEYISAPSGYDPRMPFVEGAEVGKVKIWVRAYKDQKITDTVPNLQGQKVTRRGQKFKAPAVVDDAKIEREISELFSKKDAPQPVFDLDDRGLGDEDDDDDKKKSVTEERDKKLERKLSKLSTPPKSEKKKIVLEDSNSASNQKFGNISESNAKRSKLIDSNNAKLDEIGLDTC
ncbi:unnamed protein product [Thelazia callipaeda]|uniref:Major sperm protein n=1 Tax=Thelazia callipaeda TaxID=103827 RepID=A0A0N5DBQ7_THECL|nr:unnamed protein product [Thelazia callipaeda]